MDFNLPNYLSNLNLIGFVEQKCLTKKGPFYFMLKGKLNYYLHHLEVFGLYVFELSYHVVFITKVLKGMLTRFFLLHFLNIFHLSHLFVIVIEIHQFQESTKLHHLYF